MDDAVKLVGLSATISIRQQIVQLQTPLMLSSTTRGEEEVCKIVAACWHVANRMDVVFSLFSVIFAVFIPISSVMCV